MKKAVCLLFCVILLFSPISVSAVSTSAKAAILINGDTGETIFEQKADCQLPMASTTKIMTALLLCESGDLQKEITVTSQMLRVEGSSMGLLAGDRVTLHDLLYGMLLASGNDAANVTACILGGTVDGFVKLMNEKAAELRLKNTHFETPSGLDGDSHYTTARDLAMLARYAMQNEIFAEAASSKSAVLNYGNPPYKRTLTNHNKLLKSFDGAIGVKTGFTKKSGRCLVSAAKRDGKYVIAVTLNDPDDWKDHTTLLEYGLEKITLTEISPEKASYSLPVVGADIRNINVNMPTRFFSTVDDEQISCEVNLPKFVYAPITKGEVLGSLVYKKGNEVIDSVPLSADINIEPSAIKRGLAEIIFEKIKYIYFNLWEK